MLAARVVASCTCLAVVAFSSESTNFSTMYSQSVDGDSDGIAACKAERTCTSAYQAASPTITRPISKEQLLLQVQTHRLAVVQRHVREETFGKVSKALLNSSSTGCSPSSVQRRRRNAEMCSCRRRSGRADLASGLVCEGNEIVTSTTTTTTPCVGDDCPIGWNATDSTSGTGKWCEVGRPPSGWLALKTCPSALQNINVKIMSYNLFWWNLFDRQGGHDAAKLIAEQSAHDFMGFQECKNVDHVIDLAKGYGLSGDYETLSLVKEDRALGVAYLSSAWKLLDNGWEDVGEDRSWAYYGKRAALWGRFQHSTGSVVFFINHHGPLSINAGGSCAGSATAYNIMRVIAEKAHAGDLVVLVGDFNAQPGSSRINALDAYMNRIFTGSSHGGVDHVFSNCEQSTFLEKKNLGPGGSDHDSLSVLFSHHSGS